MAEEVFEVAKRDLKEHSSSWTPPLRDRPTGPSAFFTIYRLGAGATFVTY